MSHSCSEILKVNKMYAIRQRLFEINWDRQAGKASGQLLLDSHPCSRTVPSVSLRSLADRGLCTIHLLQLHSWLCAPFSPCNQPWEFIHYTNCIWHHLTFFDSNSQIRSLSNSSSVSSWHNKSDQSSNWKEHKPKLLGGPGSSFTDYLLQTQYLFLLLFRLN